MKRFLSAVAGALLLQGCAEVSSYKGPSKAVTLPSHIQKIAVRPFVNRTQYFGLEDKLRLRVEQEVIRDGRILFVNNENEAQGVLEGDIVNYIRQVATYDQNNQPEEYRIWVIMNIRFVDQVNKLVLWEEARMEHDYRYFVETAPGGRTEEEAREVLWDLFARDIVKRMIEGFGSVTGASEKKVPERTISPADAPPPPTAPRSRVAPPSPY